MKDDVSVFIPFSKKDEDKRMVYGYASTEAVDSQGEVVEKQAIEEALPDYMKFGNIREMHQASAVGKAKSATIDKKGLFLAAKIVDDNAWNKVKEGVYNGFSIGGRKLMTMANKIKRLMLSEISIVDRPANPEALFTLVKFDKNGKSIDMTPMEAENKPDPKREEMLDMFDAAYILGIAKELAYMMMSYKTMKKPIKNLENAIKNLKSAAKDNLGKADYNIVENILNSASSLEEDVITKYAYVDGNGIGQLSLESEISVMNALAKFGQINFDSDKIKFETAQKILDACEKFKIRVSPNSEVSICAKGKINKVEVWFNYEEAKYFEDLKKVLG